MKHMHKVVNQYNAFKLNKYRETFEIVSGSVGEDDKFYMDWVIASEYDPNAGGGVPVTKDDGSYRNQPVKIIIGELGPAIENVEWLLDELKRHAGIDSEPGPDPEDDVPF